MRVRVLVCACVCLCVCVCVHARARARVHAFAQSLPTHTLAHRERARDQYTQALAINPQDAATCQHLAALLEVSNANDELCACCVQYATYTNGY